MASPDDRGRVHHRGHPDGDDRDAYRLLCDSAFLWFPIPEPGLIPVSEICTVRFSLLEFLAASASMAMTASGRVSSHHAPDDLHSLHSRSAP